MYSGFLNRVKVKGKKAEKPEQRFLVLHRFTLSSFKKPTDDESQKMIPLASNPALALKVDEKKHCYIEIAVEKDT